MVTNEIQQSFVSMTVKKTKKTKKTMKKNEKKKKKNKNDKKRIEGRKIRRK